MANIAYLCIKLKQTMKRIFLASTVLAFAAACTVGTTDNVSDYETDPADLDPKNEMHEHGEANGSDMPATPEGARVFFANLEDGQEVTSPVYIEFGVEGIGVEPAGPVNEGMGHHHILINEEPTPHGVAVPADDTHIHYGGGQTSDTLDLPAGEHTLVLQFADGIHRSYGEQLSASIKVKVTE